MKKTSRPLLAICYQVTALNGKISYLFGTRHCYYKCPKELEKLELDHVLVEIDNFKTPQSLPRRLLDEQIIAMAYNKKILVTALDDQENLREILSELYKIDSSDLDKLFEPDAFKKTNIILHNMQDSDYYLTQDLKQLDLSQGVDCSPELNKKVQVDRNSRWEKTICDQLEKGNVLIAVGLLHILDDGGYIDILTQKGYKLEPYPVTIEKDTADVEKNLKELPRQAPSELLFKEMKKGVLPTQLELRRLTIAYHQKKPWTSAQKDRINECIYRSFPEKESCRFDFLKDHHLKQSVYLSGYSLLDYYSKNIHLLFKGMSAKDIQENVFNFFKEQKEGEIPTQINLGEQNRVAFVICLFFPDIAKNLFKLFFDEKLYQAAELLILFGATIDETNKEQIKFYEEIIKNFPEEKSAAVEKINLTIQDKNIPAWLMTAIEKTVEVDCWVLEDINQELFTKHLPQLEKTEIDSLIKLFYQYKDAKKWQKQSWQVKILLQRILLTLTQSPYRNESAILTLSSYYHQGIGKLQSSELVMAGYSSADPRYKESQIFAVKKNIFLFHDEKMQIKYSRLNELCLKCHSPASPLKNDIETLLRGLMFMQESKEGGIVSVPKIIFMSVKAEILQRLEKESTESFSLFRSADTKKFITAIKKGLMTIEVLSTLPKGSDDESDFSSESSDYPSEWETGKLSDASDEELGTRPSFQGRS